MALTDTIYAYRFLRILTTKWVDQDAYKLGVIDENGNTIIDTRKLDANQRESYTVFHKLVFNLKRLLEKVPGGKSTIASYAAAIYLIKEHSESPSLNVIMDAVYQNANVSGHLTESFWMVDEYLSPGRFLLTRDIISESTGDVIAHRGSQVVSKDYNAPIDLIGSVPVFHVKHSLSGQNIVVSAEDITR